MKSPTVLIVTNYRQLFAYLIQPDGSPQVLEHIDFQHDCQTGVALIDWRDDDTSYLKLTACITDILNRYHPESWRLACPEGLAEKIMKILNPSYRESLAAIRTQEVDDVSISNVTAVFASENSEMRSTADSAI
ncbi:MAG: hypothetical protein ABI162_08290 [Luteolibacter sp.]